MNDDASCDHVAPARRLHPNTLAVSSGRDAGPGAPLNVPPTFAATYRDGGPVGYGRWANPTWHALESALGALEGGHAVVYSCGQAAISAVLATLRPGAVVVHPSDSYAGTRGLLGARRAGGQLDLRAVDVTDTARVLDALDGADLIWLESPTNPSLGIAELPRIIAGTRRAGVKSVVDNTFATPVLQCPLEWGAWGVVHSATKYIGGHSDLLLGAVVVADESDASALVAHRTLEGAVPGVMEAYLALRGLRTLPVRIERQQETAGILAARLAAHPAVRRVRYPGLPEDPYHDRARAQMRGFGAIVSFELSSALAADRVVEHLELVVPTTSLGGVESTIERRQRWPGEEHLHPGLLRLSVGLEHPGDLWADLAGAIDAIDAIDATGATGTAPGSRGARS